MPVSIEVLDALAARRATFFSVELDLHRVVIEGDSEIVFKALSIEYFDWSCIGHIVKDRKSISGFLQTYYFSHTKWQDNSIAHTLAKRVRMFSPHLVWMESILANISYLVFVDVIP